MIAQVDPAVINPPCDAGTTLRAAAALRTGQPHYTDAQVAYLIALAYDAGRTAAYAADIADRHAAWAAGHWRIARADRIAAELADMDRAARVRAARDGRPYRPHPGGPVDWDTGQPLRLEAA